MAKEEVLKRLEDEVKSDLGITEVGPNMTTQEAGKLGGQMVKRMIMDAEKGMDMGGLEEDVKRNLGITEIGPNMTTEQAGKLGGYMVKRMIEKEEKGEQEA
jgi:hypothetical protein